MGKTNPTYRDRLQAWEDDWQSFRRALRMPRRDHFDEICVMAYDSAAAAGFQNPHDLETAILVTVCVHQQERIAELQERLDDLEATVEVADA